MKSPEELKLWKMLRRISSSTSVQLNNKSIDRAEKVTQFELYGLVVRIVAEEGKVEVVKGDTQTEISMQLLKKQPSKAFHVISELLV
ncbi:hypothetical protein [Aquibacillus albus]|uniref:3,4-dihydroxy-2-butanone 4-phosphate synthase n=1 Tax=Aquibacillus albus TaxID=1168171 RepID=A0ABS2N0M8_9BACI|nr:hypothetical protein [Aquibacillus albus]MBM7571691.1 3,4-dihydroxy-2-butanone 4-phosphate synthase [Aquibacillus albus]